MSGSVHPAREPVPSPKPGRSYANRPLPRCAGQIAKAIHVIMAGQNERMKRIIVIHSSAAFSLACTGHGGCDPCTVGHRGEPEDICDVAFPREEPGFTVEVVHPIQGIAGRMTLREVQLGGADVERCSVPDCRGLDFDVALAPVEVSTCGLSRGDDGRTWRDAYGLVLLVVARHRRPLRAGRRSRQVSARLLLGNVHLAVWSGLAVGGHHHPCCGRSGRPVRVCQALNMTLLCVQQQSKGVQKWRT